MSIFSELEKIKSRTLLLLIVLFFLIITPGFAGVFIFDRSLFVQLDTFKLVLLAVTIMLPVIIYNQYIMYVLGGSKKDGQGFEFGSASAIFLAAGEVYAVSILAYVGQIPIENVVVLTLGVLVCIFVFAQYISWNSTR
jgi:hypothetical protein